jgi:hypothetical protein
VYFSPYRQCRWCRPGGLVGGSLLARLGGHEPPPRLKRRCWRCKGTRLTRRLGAKQVHKARLSLQQAWEERGRNRQRPDQQGRQARKGNDHGTVRDGLVHAHR